MKRFCITFLVASLVITGCRQKLRDIESLEQLERGKTFAVPTGTVADQSVLKRFPDAKLGYYNTVYDCALAVVNGQADAAIYDKPVLKNIAGKNQGMKVLEEVLFPDQYGFAVALDNHSLKKAIDETLDELKASGIYDEMLERWLPARGAPAPMPEFGNEGQEGVLVFGTAAVIEPMSFVHGEQGIVGFDIEFAQRIANSLNRKLEVVNMEFGAMLPALISGKVDMIGAGLSITEERARSVLFSACYYESGIAALVRSSDTAQSQGITGTDNSHQRKWSSVGVLMGSVHESYAIKKYPDAQILTYNSVSDLLTALEAGKIDGSFMDHTSLKDVFAANPNFIILEEKLFSVDIGAGFQEQSDELRHQFNTFLKEIRTNGIYDEMEKRWMVETGSELPEIPLKTTGGVLRVGVVSDIGLPFTVKVEGKWKGFDVELSTRFAAWLGRDLEFVDMPFGSLIPAMVSGKIDMITASMMITEEREKAIDFSDAYCNAGVSIIGMKDNKQAAGTGVIGGYDNKDETTDQTFLNKLGESFYNNIILEKRYLMILRGLWITIIISVFAAITGTLLGALVCSMRMSKSSIRRNIAYWYISLVRGTPVLVLLMITYYVIFASVNINPVAVAVIAFGINFAAYVSEMFRTGIQGVDKGQKEAGIATGFTKVQVFIHIIMPQALRTILPVYKGEFISLLKMTSIVGYIAVEDLTKASDIIRSRTFDAFFPLIMAAVIYLVLAYLLTYALDRIEINIDPVKRRMNMRKEAAL